MSGRATTIDALRIFGFGRFADLEIELGRGLNLLVGPNEAGKSTLLAFLRSVLFGFERRQSPRRFEPRSGYPFGGELTLKTPSGTLVVQRSGGRRRAEGELSVRDDAGCSARSSPSPSTSSRTSRRWRRNRRCPRPSSPPVCRAPTGSLRP